MQRSTLMMIAGSMVGFLSLAPVALAQTPAKPADPPKGEAVLASTRVTATVTQIDMTGSTPRLIIGTMEIDLADIAAIANDRMIGCSGWPARAPFCGWNNVAT